MGETLKAAFGIVWASVANRFILLPAAVATFLGYLGLDPEGVVPMNEWNVPVEWLAAVFLLLFWALLGTAWRAAKLQVAADADPDPDSPINLAFHYVAQESVWALGADPHIDSFYDRLETELRDAARAGRLIVWARPSGALGKTPPLKRFEPHDWDNTEFELTTCMLNTEQTGRLIQRSPLGQDALFEDARVNMAQVKRNWPKAGLFRRWRDNLYDSRKRFLEAEGRG